MFAIALLALTTLLYAGYNILVKQSADQVDIATSSTITATIALQFAALTTSLIFAAVLKLQGGSSLMLSPAAYVWAIAAGLCIGAAEIAYFYLFAGVGAEAPMPANVAIPTIVSGTILLAMFASWALFKEPMAWPQLLGAVVIAFGVFLLFLRR